MATIDSLLIKLGFDTSEFDKGKNKVDAGLKSSGTEADKTGAKFKQSGNDGAQGFENVASSAAKFLALIGGTMAIKRFIEQTVASNSALDRFSKNLNESANSISAFSNAAELAGGSAEGLQGTMDMLSRSQTELQLTGQSGLIPYFAALGVSLADTQGKAKPVSGLLLELSDRFSKMDRTTANNFGRMMGIDQGTMQLLLKGRSEIELTLARQKEYSAVTDKQAEQASRLRGAMVSSRQSFEAFGRELLSKATPALEKLLGAFENFGAWVRENSEFVQTFLTIMAVGIAAVGASLIPINLTAVAIVALGAAIAGLYQDYQVWKRGGESFIDWAKWEPGIKLAGEGIKFMRDLLIDLVYRAIAAGDTIAKVFQGDFAGAKIASKAVIEGISKLPTENSNASTSQGAAPGARQNQAMRYFQAQGYTQNQAAGLVANISRESAFDPAAVGDGGKAYGILQWHPDRQNEFKKLFGKDIKGSSFDDQMAFMQYELTQGNERRAGDALRNTTSAGEAAAVLSKRYVRPADAEGEARRRASLAMSFAGVPGASQAASGAGAPQMAQASVNSAPAGSNQSVVNTIGEVKVYSAATDAAGIAKDMGDSLDYLFTSQANYGLN